MNARSSAGALPAASRLQSPRSSGTPGLSPLATNLFVEVWSLATRARGDPCTERTDGDHQGLGLARSRAVTCSVMGWRHKLCLIVASVAAVSRASSILLARCHSFVRQTPAHQGDDFASFPVLAPFFLGFIISRCLCALACFARRLIGLGHLHAFRPWRHALTCGPASNAIGVDVIVSRIIRHSPWKHQYT